MEKMVITIARSYGSGGRTLGKKLADVFGIHCYDRELLRMASDESGINEALFGEADENLKRMPLFRIAKDAYKGDWDESAQLTEDHKPLQPGTLYRVIKENDTKTLVVAK